MLELQNLHWKYGSVEVLKKISFKAEPGDILGILGENGAGKSTLLNLLSGLFYPRKGTISWKGLHSTAAPEAYRSSIAYLPEGSPLPAGRKTGEYLQSQGEVFSCPPDIYREVLQITGLEEVWIRPMGKLSRGYRQRIGLAATLMKSPGFLLLDEPFSGLDPAQVLSLRTWLQQHSSSRLTVFSSHILPEVYALCNRILVLEEGRIKGDFQKEDLNGPEELEALFSREELHEA